MDRELTDSFSKCDMWNVGYPDSKVHGAYMGPTWVLSAPGGPHVGPTILAIWVCYLDSICETKGTNTTYDIGFASS